MVGRTIVGSWRPTLLLVLGLLAARVAYLAFFCPYTLVEDEAHYWEWTRDLGLSYYSKGPGIAWTIAATTGIFGDHAWAVRLGAPVFLAVLALACAGLAADVSGDRRAGLCAAALVNLVPLYQMGGVLLTIDVPYCALWALSAWAFWRGLSRGGVWWFAAGGALLGCSFLYKYTAALLLPGVFGFALLHRRSVRFGPAALAAALGAFALACWPVLLWNHLHDWPTFRHLLGHLGVRGGDVAPAPGRGWTPAWLLEFIGINLGLYGAPALLGGMSAFETFRTRGNKTPTSPEDRAGRAYLLACALPILAFYLAVALVTDGEGNWTAAGYTTLASLGGIGAVEGARWLRERRRAWRALPEPRPREGVFRRAPEDGRVILWHASIIAGVLVGVGMLRLDWAARLPGLGGVVPVGRLVDADVRGAHAGELLGALGNGAFVIGQHYGRASQMSFYVPGRPTVYCSSAWMGGRKTQYDMWERTSLDNPALLGRNAVLLGASAEEWALAFERVEPAGELRGERKRGRAAFLGFGYRGWPGMRVRDGGGSGAQIPGAATEGEP